MMKTFHIDSINETKTLAEILESFDFEAESMFRPTENDLREISRLQAKTEIVLDHLDVNDSFIAFDSSMMSTRYRRVE